MKEIVAEAVQSEIRSAEDELIDVEGAAAMLDMTEGTLRKAVERQSTLSARRQPAAIPSLGSHARLVSAER